MKKVAVLQSNYIPWKGYFDIIQNVDTFIFYDDVQYTKNDWRNRNKLKTPQGTNWLTIPTGGNLNRLICEVELEDTSWQLKHWKTIEQYYGKTSYYKTYKEFFQYVYLENQWQSLSQLNQFLIKKIAIDFLGIKTQFQDSHMYKIKGSKLERLVDLLQKAETDIYISGPAAKGYIDESRFKEIGIELQYKDYGGYPEYGQLYPPFRHDVSIVDVLFNMGADAPEYIWDWRQS